MKPHLPTSEEMLREFCELTGLKRSQAAVYMDSELIEALAELGVRWAVDYTRWYARTHSCEGQE